MKIKFLFGNISIKKRIIIIFLIQMSVALLLASIATDKVVDTWSGIQKIRKLYNFDAYVLNDLTPYGKIYELYNNPNVKDFYKFVTDNVEEQFCMYSYLPDIVDGLTMERIVINDKFIDLFPLPTCKGRTFDKEDFLWTKGSVVPIVVGYNLQNYYELNKIYKIFSGESYMNVIVIGVLQKNLSYPSLTVLGSDKNLDNSYIIPMNETYIEYYSNFADYHMALTSTLFIPENPDILNTIIKKSTDLNLFIIDFKNLEKSIENYINSIMKKIEMTFIISLIIFLFALLGLISHINRMIYEKRKDHMIHIICGARPIDLVLRLFFELFIISIISYIPCGIYTKFSLLSFGVWIILLIFIAIALLPLLLKLQSPRLLYETRRNS